MHQQLCSVSMQKGMPRRRPDTNSHHSSSVSSAALVNNGYSFQKRHHQLVGQQQQRSGSNREKPQQRNAANARERARMRVLSRAFCRLKTTLPWVPADTKLSKLDTLRLATTYISHLRAVLVEGNNATSDNASQHPSHPLSMSWPFMFGKSSCNGGTNSPSSGSESPLSTSSSVNSDHFSFQENPSSSATSKTTLLQLQSSYNTLTHQHNEHIGALLDDVQHIARNIGSNIKDLHGPEDQPRSTHSGLPPFPRPQRPNCQRVGLFSTNGDDDAVELDYQTEQIMELV